MLSYGRARDIVFVAALMLQRKERPADDTALAGHALYRKEHYCISSSLALSLCRHYECSGTSYTKRPYKPAGDVELAGHAVHALAPGASLYFPASHAVHGPPLGPVYPVLHSQSSRASLAAFTCAQMRAHTITNADTHA